MTQSEASAARPAEPDVVPASPGHARSLNSQIRSLLLECPSQQQFYEKVLQVCARQFSATVGRVDFHVGDAPQSRIVHDSRLARNLADRFSTEYLAPLSQEVQKLANPEPRLKRYERGDQKMTLISAPVLDIARNRTAGAITLMLGGGNWKSDVVLARLDGLAAVVSTALVAKAGTLTHNSLQSARPASANSTSPEHRDASKPVVPAAARTTDPAQKIAEAAALAKSADFRSTRELGFSLVNSLCTQMQAEQVFFGVAANQRIQVEAASGVADFKASSPGVALVRQAMEEALDHQNVIVSQPQPPENMTSLPIHQKWSADNNHACVCSIPLPHGDEIAGIISVRRPSNRPFTGEELEKFERSLKPYGAALRVVEKANRSVKAQLQAAVSGSVRRNLAAGSVGRKVLMGLCAVTLLWFCFGAMTYRPLCQSRVTAAELRHFSAPFDGKLRQVHVRPGQKVKQGDLLVEFDTSELQLELNTLEREIASAQVELRQAISDNDMSAAALTRSRIQVLESRVASISRRIQDARITAPGDGTVVLSDLEQRIGQVFSHGEEILQFAADGNWLLEIEVPDDIVSYVAANQTGTFAAAALPTEKLNFTIQDIDGAAAVMNDRNIFIARAPLASHPDWMKTGMQGTAQVQTVDRPVWWVAMHRAVDWARTNFWL
ncbi:MAG: biotin/lipoyl-binding protein [Fuerstiella sp.]